MGILVIGHLPKLWVAPASYADFAPCTQNPVAVDTFLEQEEKQTIPNSAWTRPSNLQSPSCSTQAGSILFQQIRRLPSRGSSKPHLTPQTSGPSSSCGDEVLTSRRVPHAFCRDPQCGHGDSGACSLRSPIACETMRLQLSRLQHVLCKRLATLLCGN